ncbi:Arc family DNA-binding protein [Acinetobacter modestus]|uniref:Arc family DNA-binding protein n=1 Tax=Acinetobacter modestus TaxID=1776740 RepID=UPI001F4A78DC|nr:Arc family DNA-binding protein [Acinetobacter modestus]MCH7329543.1 Arc family DNA-binding protein [Acinetobacter modestus]
MTEDAQLKIRLSQELKSILEERSKSNNRTMNGEIVNILEHALLDTKAKSGRSIYFNDLNCVEDYPKEPLHERTARVEQMISNLFYRNPQFELINIETLNNGEKIRYWYSIPRSESFRD